MDEPLYCRKQKAHRYPTHQRAGDALKRPKSAPVRRKAYITTADGPISSADFKDRARRAYAVLVTGESRRYGNILLRKGTVKPN